MNRSVMKRQMFAKGGAAFPDLSGDGEITQKDILMGRGVQFMQDGGMPMAEPTLTPPMEPMATGPEQMDPQVLEGAMMTASQNFGDLDQAQNYEEVIDSIRGDELPIEQRYQELAQFVGPNDAQQTPESVLAMVQPVIQMAAVDGGIGGLAAEQMNTEVSGPMAEGIMSTVAMEGGEEPPVNFNQGGDARRNTQDVKYYNYGGAVEYTGPRMPDRGYASKLMMDPRGPVNFGGRKSKAQLSLEPFKEYLAEEVQNKAMQDVTSQVDPFIQDISAQASEKFGLNQGGQLLMNGTGTQMPLPSLNAIPLAPSKSPLLNDQITDSMELPFLGRPAFQGQYGVQNRGPMAFADGGPVQYYQEAGVVTPLEQEMDSRLALYERMGLGSQAERDAALANQRNLTQSQMLFDIAGAGLALAGGDGSKSFAQNLAEAAQNTQLFDKLSARTQSLSDFQTAQKKEERDIRLAALTSSEAALTASAKAKAALEEQAIENAFQLTMLDKQQTFKKGENQTNRDHSLTLAEKQNQYRTTLQSIENDNSMAAIRLRGQLAEKLAKINNEAASALAGDKFDQQMKMRNLNSADQFAQIGLQHNNALEKLEKTKENEIERMELNQDFTIKRDNHLAGIQSAAAETKMAFDAKQAALGRLQTWSLTRFEAELRKELQKNGFTEAAIDREIKTAQQTFENDITTKQLDLQAAIAAVDAQYKKDKIEIDKAAANAIKLDNKGDIMSYVSNEERIAQYARNELGANTALFETVLADYYREKVGSWDGENYVMNPAPKLTDALISAIEQRQANGLSIPNFSGDVGFDGKLDPSEVEVVFDPQNAPDFNTDPTAWRKALFSGPNKSVQLDPNLWASVPTNIASEGVDYTSVVGLSALPKGLQKAFENLGFEIGIFDKISDGSIKFSEGQKDLTVLANRVLLGITNMSSDRVLKSVVDEIQKEVQNLKPGIFQYTTDTGATLNAIASQLSENIQNIAKGLPEFEGEVGDRTKASIQKNRASMDESIGLLAEVLKVRDKFYSSFANQKTDQQINTKQKNIDYLKQLRK